MKSAYELAMERLEEEHGREPSLSNKQKTAIAEVDQRMNASLAELEILFRDRMAAASARGDYGEVDKLNSAFMSEKKQIEARAESEKDAVRRDESLA